MLAIQETVSATLTQGEMAPRRNHPLARFYSKYPLWRNDLSQLTDEGRAVQLLLAGGVVVEGWMTRRFLGRPTYWTWDPRFSRVSWLPGEDAPLLPSCVEPIAWAEKAAGAA